ncbi:MAG: hypothetical protein K8R53_09955 [Bacteroidales bacterium]|nr:hypothetical protein [Bacteroidales bacterium]
MNYLKYFFGIVSLVLIILIAGCKKDDNNDDNNNPSQSAYRIVEELIYEDGTENLKEVYNYKDNKIHEVITYDYNGKDLWNEDLKEDYSYEGSSVIIDGYEYVTGVWQPSDKKEIEFANGVWSEYTEYNYDGGEYLPVSKSEYNYDSDKLVEMVDYTYVGGNEIPEYKVEYEWGSDGIAFGTTYNYLNNEWQKTTKDSVYYSDGKIVKVESFFYGQNLVAFKIEYTYDGDKMATATSYVVQYNGTWLESSKNTYTYDENGNLEETVNHVDYFGQKTFRSVYSYDKAAGNFRSIWGAGSGWYSWYPMPTKNSLNPELIKQQMQFRK